MEPTPELKQQAYGVFTRMKRKTIAYAEAEAHRALKPLVTSGGTHIHMSAGGDVTFVYDNGAASTLWTITHSLNKFPTVIVVDTSNIQMEGLITYIDANEITIEFNTAVDGKAYLS